MANASNNAATAPAGNAIETAHEDMIVSLPTLPSRSRNRRNADSTGYRSQHDAQLDYYGKRLATCSSDRTVRVFNVVDGKASGEGVVLKGSVIPLLRRRVILIEHTVQPHRTCLASRMGSSLLRDDPRVVFVRLESLRMEGEGAGDAWWCRRWI